MARKQRGLGSIFKKKIKLADGSAYESPYWYIQYCVNGRPIKESSRSVKYGDAERLLKRRISEITMGAYGGPQIARITLGELLKDLIADYTRQEKSLAHFAQPAVDRHLAPWFGQMKAARLSTGQLNTYIEHRQKEGAANASINRELALLRRALNLGKYNTPPKVVAMPRFQMLPENNVRKGFFEHKDYTKMLKALPIDEKPVLAFGYYTGCRLGEILELQWTQVDLKTYEVRLHADETKNGEPRIIPLGGPGNELYDTLVAQYERRKKVAPHCPWVFFRANGKPVRNIAHNWEEACKETGVKKLFHDLRRSGVRNLVRAGVPESVAMRISGHKTRSVFERYNIVSDKDLQEASVKLHNYVKTNVYETGPRNVNGGSSGVGSTGSEDSGADSEDTGNAGSRRDGGEV